MKIHKKVIKQVLVYTLLVGIAIGLVLISQSRLKDSETGETYSFTCDFETQDSSGSISTMPDFSIPTVKTSQQYYLSGSKSLAIPNYMEFYELIVLPDVVGPSNISFEIYRKKGSTAYIALQGKQDKMFYYQSSVVVETVNEEWELLKIRAIASMDFKDSILLYIHNPDKQTCYFDDLKVNVDYGKYYPKYNEEPLIVFIEPNEMLKLEQNRQEALNEGVLTTNDDSWVRALVYGEGKMMHAEVRLKGDWLDHLIGDKISLRIKLKYDSWKGMRVFSIQTPYSRGFTNEWIMHQACHHEDILTTRFGFVPVYINGKSVGIYAYEEHFQKELIEASKRREGPIIKFSEEDFWFFMRIGFQKGFPYEQSVIEPFSEAKIAEDTVQFRYFVNAQNLLQMFRNLDAKASDIFDVKKMAKFIAFLNSKNSVHALIWHNMRFYYNPVLCRLEPVVFDMYPGPNEYENNLPIWTFMSGFSLDTRANSFFYLMADTTFKTEYLRLLDYYTFEHDFNYYRNLFAKDYIKNDSLIKMEFVPFYTDTVQFTKIKGRLTKLIPDFLDSLSRPDYLERVSMLDTCKFNTRWPKMPELYADKYLRCFESEDGKIFIRAYLNQDFTIVGTGDEEGINEENTIAVKRPQTNLVFDYKTDITSGDDEYLYFKINVKDTLFKAKIYPWPAPTNFNPRNHMAANAVDLSKFTDAKTKTITF
ncbi:MAG: hypothetical protein PHE56_06630, partial [Bacteroidales bacterium]|nr:hypothetical protein [Bacteroidales bacterium]